MGKRAPRCRIVRRSWPYSAFAFTNRFTYPVGTSKKLLSGLGVGCLFCKMRRLVDLRERCASLSLNRSRSAALKLR